MATMANLPSPTKVSGKFSAIYDAYYHLIDPKGLGTIEAMVAAKFLKKSGLSDVVLSRIWDLSDPTGRGFLDREGFFVALKLVALAQAGHDINMRNIFLESPNPPKVGEIPKIVPPKIQTVQPHTQDWSVSPADRIKYDQLFDSLLPVDGLLPGNKVRTVLMDSKLPLEALSKIWDLADQDKDGSLDKHEFLVAMHLVYMALGKKMIPAGLPIELQRPKETHTSSGAFDTGDAGGFVANFPTDIAPPPVVPTLPRPSPSIPPIIPPLPRPAMSQPVQPTLIPTDLLIQTAPTVDWVVSLPDRQRFDIMFKRSDLDNDGLVSGHEIKDVFLQSGIPNLCLAQIWALCDTNQSGKLTSEQFSLAMWLVERKRMGYEPPECLAPNMVPPSQRPPAAAGPLMSGSSLVGDLVGLDDNLMQAIAEPMQPAFSNPELTMISKEIEELSRERRFLENDVTQKEADIRIKSGEVRSLQSELDTLAATLKQLENQKGEAQKRLDDLKAQVNKIRDKCQKQEDSIREMEGELDSKRSELQKLKDEETSLEREYDTNKQELDSLTRTLQDTQIQISQLKGMVVQLQESQRQMKDALSVFKSAVAANDPMQVADYQLNLEPDFRKAKQTLEVKENNSSADNFNSNGFASDSFSEVPKSSGFDTNFSQSTGGFNDSFGNTGFSSAADPFQETPKHIDPFGDKSAAHSVTPDPSKDDFGSDPFAILHAPTSATQAISPSRPAGPPGRPESPSPALPPKKGKQPPPRPAPPRPSMGPTPTRPEQPTQGFGSSGGGFADFANFDDTNMVNFNAPSKPRHLSPTMPAEPTVAPVPVAAAVKIPADFADDPFKDYRYEDPFSIKDPFADESIDDPFTSITAVVPNQTDIPTSSTISVSRTSNNNTPVLTNAAPHFNSNHNVNITPTPMTSNTPTFAANFNSHFNTEPSLLLTNNASATSASSDFFDAFHDQFNKNTTTTTTTTTLQTKPSADPFGLTNDSNANLKPTTASFPADFGDNLFEDEFSKTDSKPVTTSDFAKFDAFNDNITMSIESQNFANFEDSFSSSVFTTSAKQEANTFNVPSPANGANHKDKNSVAETAPKATRYAADYSQSESFSKDLDEVLKRSLVDQ